MANTLSIELAKRNYKVQTGKSIIIQAVVKNWTKPKEKILLWSADKGTIDKNGKYTAPVVLADDDDTVTVSCVEDRAIEETVDIDIVHTEAESEFVHIGEIKPIGSDGKYALNIQCLNKKKAGHRCSIIITDYNQSASTILPAPTYIVDASNPDAKPPAGEIPIRKLSKFQIQVKTTKMGFVSVHLKPFKERVRTLHVRVKGSEIDREVVLTGPKPKVKLKKSAGFWANAMQK